MNLSWPCLAIFLLSSSSFTLPPRPVRASGAKKPRSLYCRLWGRGTAKTKSESESRIDLSAADVKN
jgi:hypothetical protein